MNAKLAIAILDLLAELGPTLQAIWSNLTVEERKQIFDRYTTTMNTFSSMIANNDANADAIAHGK